MKMEEASKGKIKNWIEERTPEPPRYMLDALEKTKEPLGNVLRVPILVGFDLSNMKSTYLELIRKGNSWYLNN